MNRPKKITLTLLGIAASVGLWSFTKIYHVSPYFDKVHQKWRFMYGRHSWYGDFNEITFCEDGKLISIKHLGCG